MAICTMRCDASARFNYNWNRYYDPTTAKYITSDPVGVEVGLSTYLYSNSNPIAYYDLFGLWVKRCARGLGDKDKPAMKPSGNLLRHDYLSVSGGIYSFQAGRNKWAWTSMLWSQGWIDNVNEYDANPMCRMICKDDKFDKYVREAAKEIGQPKYAVNAYPTTLQHLFGARNCQTWVNDVLALAKKNYLANEKCPKCFSGSSGGATGSW